MQGFDLAWAPLFLGLRDTRLQPPHLVLDSAPIDGVPFRGGRERTRGLGGLRHLHSLVGVVHQTLSRRDTRRTWARFRVRPQGPVSAPLQRGIRFFRHPKPADRSVHLTVGPLAGACASAGGLRGFHVPSMKRVRLGTCCRPVGYVIHEAAPLKPRSVPRCHFGQSLISCRRPRGASARTTTLALSSFTVFIADSHVFAILTALPLPRLWFPGGRLSRDRLPARRSGLPYFVPVALYSDR